jgi:hypothetical protein
VADAISDMTVSSLAFSKTESGDTMFRRVRCGVAHHISVRGIPLNPPANGALKRVASSWAGLSWLTADGFLVHLALLMNMVGCGGPAVDVDSRRHFIEGLQQGGQGSRHSAIGQAGPHGCWPWHRLESMSG